KSTRNRTSGWQRLSRHPPNGGWHLPCRSPCLTCPRPTCVFLASPPTSSARPCIALTPIRAQRCRRLACQAAGRRASELTVHFHLDRGLVIGVRLPLQMKPRATCPLLPLLASPPR